MSGGAEKQRSTTVAGGPVGGATGANPPNQVSVRSRVDGSSNEEDRIRRRRKLLDRYAGRDMSRRLLDGAGLRDLRLRRCGWRLGEERTFRLGSDGKARSVGVERCGNGRCCPICGPNIAAVRAAEVGTATWRWMTSGEDRDAVFISIAASHKRTDRLDDLHHQLLEARGHVMRSDSRSWKAFRKRYGVVDMSWRAEHSIGWNGPHVGLHLVMLTTRWWDADDAQGAETWLLLRFREELARAGFTGRLSATNGIDIRPVDDPVFAAQYLNKWGVGNELACESSKLGRNGENVPYAAIPSILAVDLGRQDPFGPRYQRDRNVKLLVDGWVDYVKLAAKDERKWYRGFRKLNDYVPELRDAHRPVEKIAVCVEALPQELRPPELDDSETEEDSEGGSLLAVEADVWSGAQRAWWRRTGLDLAWARRRYRWLEGSDGPIIPLELAIVWIAEDEGMAAAAEAIADLGGGTARMDDSGWRVIAS